MLEYGPFLLTDIYQKLKMIYMKDEVTAFQLGSSTVITLPKELGIRPGQKLKIRKEKRGVLLKNRKMSESEVRKLLDSLKVDLHLKKGLTPEEINQELDRRYEDMLP